MTQTVDRQKAIARYAQTLEPLFDLRQYRDAEAIFQLACCLVRADGMEDEDWDPIYESEALVNDLARLSIQELDATTFDHPLRTRLRLSLLAYCHTTEADYFQHLIANLLRLKGGHRYSIDPFFDLGKPVRRKKGDQRGNQSPKDRLPPTMNTKLNRIDELGKAAGLDVRALIDEFYFPDIRNSVFHADYVLTDVEFRMRGGLHRQKENYYSPKVSLAELENIVHLSFAYYSAIMTLHQMARRQFFEMFEGWVLPFDGHYKALIEFTFDEGLLCGFRAYWPNGNLSEFTRTKSMGVRGMNTMFARDLSIDFMVGILASKPGEFSPLVEASGQAKYSSSVKGFPIHWPPNLKPYKLDASER